MKHYRILSCLAAVALCVIGLTACNEVDTVGGGPSDKSFFSQETLNYNLTTDPGIVIPVVRLGTSGDLTVNVTTVGSSIFSVPGSVVIKDGQRIGELVVTYDQKALNFNELYELDVTIGNFSSIYGFETAHVVIEYPTSYFEFGAGTIYEDWWGEQEDKTLFVREFADNVYQCFLPQCWGHDSGGPDHYPVQDYVFFWNTQTNKLYIPVQWMGCEDWCIADQGAIACKFGGPGHKEGSADWMKYIDSFYAGIDMIQPHYDPAKKAFYLSDSAAIDPNTGAVVYGTPGKPDIFYLE